MSVIKGFKDFLMRGNVVDLAVAVVIGAAFTGVVTAFTGKIINPLIASFGSASGGNGLAFHIRGTSDATLIDIGAVITALINFVIVAAVVYFLVIVPMNTLLERRKRGDEAEVVATPEDIALLQEIRDLLAAQHSRGTTPLQ